jgi:hypothetical protein
VGPALRRRMNQRSKGVEVQQLKKCSGHAEPEMVEPVVGAEPDAVGGPAAPRAVVPRAATQNAKAWIPAHSRIFPGRSVGRRTAVIFVRVVLDPFQDVAVHVVEAPAIRRVSSDLAGVT